MFPSKVRFLGHYQNDMHTNETEKIHINKMVSAAAAAAKLLQSCPTLCDPIEQLIRLLIPGILQARILEQVAMPSPMHESESEVAQSCPTLSDPMECSLPGSSIHGIFQARVLEWGAIAFSENGV